VSDHTPPTHPVDELELLRPALPIQVVRSELDVEQVDRWAHQVVELIGLWKVGPAGVMQVIETDRSTRDIPEEYRELVARRALQLRRMDGKEPKPMAGVTKRARMRIFLRDHLQEHPGHELTECYLALPESERKGLNEASFGTTYFHPLRKQLREAGEIPMPEGEPKMVTPEPETQPSPDPQVSVEAAPQEEEPEEVERSEAAFSWGKVVHEIMIRSPLILLERPGRGRLEVGEKEDGSGHHVHLVLSDADEDLVSRITAVAWEEIIGVEGP
jgi:hypothetical protein